MKLNSAFSNSTMKATFCLLYISTARAINLFGINVGVDLDLGAEVNVTPSPTKAPTPIPTLYPTGTPSLIPSLSPIVTSNFFNEPPNKCNGKAIILDSVVCIDAGPQAGANVTKGFEGLKDVDVVPNTNKFSDSSMCPVNVHWHLGAEHYSVGEFDENGDGPNGNTELPYRRDLADAPGGEVQDGFRCHLYDATDERFTTPYEWKHCIGMEVGETYEVHWPHSAAGACGTLDQYQTPFKDGVFCNLDEATLGLLSAQDIANAVGVQGQVFTIINDDFYYYPDMIEGWIVDEALGYGQDIAIYTGSTTGSSVNNDDCSAYSPITWQVDRKCHLISASSFDKLCFDMKNKKDDMKDDLSPNGARELVKPEFVANNQQTRQLIEEKIEDEGADNFELELGGVLNGHSNSLIRGGGHSLSDTKRG